MEARPSNFSSTKNWHQTAETHKHEKRTTMDTDLILRRLLQVAEEEGGGGVVSRRDLRWKYGFDTLQSWMSPWTYHCRKAAVLWEALAHVIRHSLVCACLGLVVVFAVLMYVTHVFIRAGVDIRGCTRVLMDALYDVSSGLRRIVQRPRTGPDRNADEIGEEDNKRFDDKEEEEEEERELACIEGVTRELVSVASAARAGKARKRAVEAWSEARGCRDCADAFYALVASTAELERWRRDIGGGEDD